MELARTKCPSKEREEETSEIELPLHPHLPIPKGQGPPYQIEPVHKRRGNETNLCRKPAGPAALRGAGLADRGQRGRDTYLLGGGPARLEVLLVQLALEHPAEAGHRLDAVEERGVGARVVVAVVVPRAHAQQRRVLLEQAQRLAEEAAGERAKRERARQPGNGPRRNRLLGTYFIS